MSLVLMERAIGMLTAGMSTRAVAHELNVLHKLSENILGKLICLLVVLIRVST